MAGFNLAGQTALVTGGAGGIGAALARALVQRGCHVALADINAEALEQTAESLRGGDVRVTTHVADMADPQVPGPLVTQVLNDHGDLTVLFNNAGVALGGTFEQVTPENFDWLMQVNFAGPVRLVRAVLPVFRKAPKAQIVNVSSLFGLVAPPGQTAYCASKFAIRGFTEALRHELEGSDIGVLTVHPGGISTDIARNAKQSVDEDPKVAAEKLAHMEKVLKMPPDKAAEIILRAVEKGRKRVLVGSDAKVVDIVQRLLPVGYWPIMRRVM